MAPQCQSIYQQKAPSLAEVANQQFLPCGQQESSDTSEEVSIYNAIRTSSGLEENVYKHNSVRPDEMLDSRMAANIAMLLPFSSEETGPHPPTNSPNCCTELGTKPCWWHAHVISDNHTPCRNSEPQQDETILQKPELSAPVLPNLQHRKVASLNDAEHRSDTSKSFRGYLSPVSPALPKYPPPIRTPTPPSLPSFGTQDAIHYPSQFHIGSSTVDGQPQRNNRRRGDKPTSYGAMWRRLLGFLPSPVRHDNSTYPVARAEDGTPVLGRLPYRQSGHGNHLVRRLDDHPFHRRALPVAQCDGVNVEDIAAASKGQWNREHCNGNRMFIVNIGASSDMNSGTPHQVAASPLPPLPNPVMFGQPQRPISTNTFNTTTSYQTCECHPPGSVVRVSTGGSGLQSSDRTNDQSACHLASTQTSAANNSQHLDTVNEEIESSWIQHLCMANPCLSCCLGAGNKRGVVIDSNTSSNDTYLTANSQQSDAKTRCQNFGEWCSGLWASLHGLTSRNFLTTEPMLG